MNCLDPEPWSLAGIVIRGYATTLRQLELFDPSAAASRRRRPRSSTGLLC